MTKLETLKQQTAEMEAKLEESTAKLKNMKAEIERLEKGWEMKCPFEDGNEIWVLNKFGDAQRHRWDKSAWIDYTFNQGNIFPTKKAAELEAKRRNLLTRFRAFRDECNGDWKADWTNDGEPQFFIYYDYEVEHFKTYADCNTDRSFNTFGYFKYDSDCRRAIDLFGDEIKELFVEGE